MSLAASPIRYPDVAPRSVMTRRGWWLVVLNFLIPGSPQVLAGSRRLGRFGLGATLALWALAVVALVVWLLWPAVLALSDAEIDERLETHRRNQTSAVPDFPSDDED